MSRRATPCSSSRSRADRCALIGLVALALLPTEPWGWLPLKLALLITGLAWVGRIAPQSSASTNRAIRLAGRTAPHARVRIEGLLRPLQADAAGRFTVRVPAALAAAHRRVGFLPGVGEWGAVREPIRLPLPQ